MNPSARQRRLQALGVLDDQGELTPYGEALAEEQAGMGPWAQEDDQSTEAEERVSEDG